MAVTTSAPPDRRWTHWLRSRWLRNAVGIAVLALALAILLDHRHDLNSASRIIARLDWPWMVLAVGAEVASMIVFARLQRWLLRAGGVRVGMRSMVEITVAGNAMGTTLPGGAAWSATWAFGQLRRRGADRVLSGWVILVAGALASFALFVLVAVVSPFTRDFRRVPGQLLLGIGIILFYFVGATRPGWKRMGAVMEPKKAASKGLAGASGMNAPMRVSRLAPAASASVV